MSKKKIDYKELYENLYDQHVDLCIENNRLNITILTLIDIYTRREKIKANAKT